MEKLNELSATAAARAIAAGEITSEALTAACLDRIGYREPDVEAWEYIDPEAALAEARARDRVAPLGPLHGVPVAFKDIIDTADMPTTYGSPIYAGHRPAGDAACVALVRAAGGVVLGKTVTTEFAFINPGKTRNPHNPAYSPGGSSSGSAAGVADFMVPLAFGTQTGGSVIRPASFCGVVGYKPTLGQFSYTGVKLLAGSLDTLGAFARHVEDLALLRAALLEAPSNVNMLDTLPRLGFCRTPWWDQADPSTQSAVSAAAESARTAGAVVEDVSLPGEFAALGDANQTIMVYEGRRSLAYEFANHEDRLSARLKSKIPLDLSISYGAYRDAIGVAIDCRRLFNGLLDNYDALIVPSAVGEAPEGLESTGNALFNRPWTTIGAPCITLPWHRGRNGLPVGVQLVARTGADEALLAVARWVEEFLR